MTAQEIRKMFPLKILITESDRASAVLERGGLHHLGNVLLKRVFPSETNNIFWGLSIGSIQGILIKTVYRDDKGKELPIYLQNNFTDSEITFELR